MTVITADGTGRGNLMVDDSIEMTEPINHEEYLTLNPDWPNLLRYFLHAMKTDSFEGAEGRQKALHSIVDITRYLALKDLATLEQIMEEIS